MHIFNSLHILIPNLLLHSRRVALSAVNLHLLSSAVLIESLFPGCNWITQDLLEHFLSTFHEGVSSRQIACGWVKCLHSALTLDG